jgi:hypothetical protein
VHRPVGIPGVICAGIAHDRPVRGELPCPQSDPGGVSRIVSRDARAGLPRHLGGVPRGERERSSLIITTHVQSHPRTRTVVTRGRE